MKTLWTKIKKISGKYKLSPTAILEIDNMVITDSHRVAEALAHHFASVGSNMNRGEEFMRFKEREESRAIGLEDGDGEYYNEEIAMCKLVSCLNAAKVTSPGRN